MRRIYLLATNDDLLTSEVSGSGSLDLTQDKTQLKHTSIKSLK